MTFRPFDVSIPHIVYAALGGFVVLFGMFSLLIREKLYIGEAPLAFVFGVIIGPYGADIFNPRSWGGGSDEEVNRITLEVTRVILAVGVFAIGVELPKAYMQRHWKSLFFLLFPAMTWGWLVSAGLIFALIPGLDFLSSLAVAACLTPTDPILAAAVVGGKYADKHVPAHLRHLLAAESGCNDGAAFPFLYLAMYLVLEASDAHAIQDWFLITWLYEVIFGIVFGAIIGFAFRHLMKFCERKDLIDRQSYVAQYVSLAIFTIGVTTLLGSDDLLAAFSCGTAFAWDGFFNRQTEQAVFSSVIDLLFNIAAFVFIGAWMPFSSFNNAELTLSVWRLIVIAILVLLLRRLPIILLLYRWIPDVKTLREAVFSGHFGPIGVGAIFISTLAAEQLSAAGGDSGSQVKLLGASIQPIVSFMVLCSITIHGLSIPFFSLGRRVHSVSRTWSRHQSTDPSGPEWATHTRRIHRPEDIIINRDCVMERGEISPGEKIILSEGREGAEPESETLSIPSNATPVKEENVFEGAEKEGAVQGGRPDMPPDGEGLTTEWQEGHDLVIETRRGPGEEVNVNVIRNSNTDGGQVQRRTFHGPRHDVEQDVKRHMERLKGLPHRLELKAGKDADRIKVKVKEGTHALDEETQQIHPRRRHSDNQLTHETSHSDDEEGWASDASGRKLDELGVATSSLGVDPSERFKSPRSKPSSKSVVPGRRRISARKGPSSRPHAKRTSSSPMPSTTVADVSPDDDDERGRSTTPKSIPSNLAARSVVHHRRIDSLRIPASRSASPARSVRSIRFADNDRPGSGASTPRTDDQDSTSSPRVMFDISHISRS